ncbi:MAG TPA: GPP34 family phosphoprotein [Humibacillus xanthopallidus]|nr:GPP34 family phosphoprotein [Humibacillus xanthopallidus]
MADLARPLPTELLLLMLDDEGRLRVDSTKRKAAVAGAAVLQLVLDGVLELEPAESRRARLVATPGAARRQSWLLDEVRERAVGRTPKEAVARIGGASDWRGRAKDIQESVLEELATAGVLERVEHGHLGVFRSTRWLVRRPEVRSAIVTRIATALDGARPDAHTAALIGVLNAVDLLPRLFPQRDKKVMRNLAVHVGELGWGADAVSEAIKQVEAAVTAAVVVSTTSVSG